MTDLTIDGVQYYIGRLNAKQQFHIARRLAPIIAKIGEQTPAPVPVQAADGSLLDATAEPGTGFNSARLYSTLATSLAELSDKDCDYIIATCMSAVQRRQGDHMIPAWNKTADLPQFADMNLAALMQITIAVITENLAGFTLDQSPTGPPAFISQPSVH